ncbi:MAG: S8 family serine peptidase, partial [Draconibacterium sp.]|nr:S8 family serine peptidase [Draconibacterium sp.]
MNSKPFLFIAILLISQSVKVNAQEFYWVAFTDKNNSEFSISSPEKYLSECSIQRRAKQNILIDSLDLPVNSNYIDSILIIGAELVHASKWLNGITVKTEISSFQNKVLEFSFVNDVQLTKPANTIKSTVNKFNEIEVTDKDSIDTSFYGASVYQTGLMNGQFLHNKGYNGEGMQIAILDAGFLNTDKYGAVDSLWVNNQILGVKDFVNPNSVIFDENYHGMSVLSCIGGNVPGSLIGTARKASFWLIRSEDANTEYIIEEDNWVAAAEFADSVGVDIINSSLGYSEFEDPITNHTYANMDGKTTRVTKGANIAASRGILVFASAGNEGNNSWKYIIAPSDGDNVIAVGAVDKNGDPAYFTSYGPAADGDIKPNVTGVGQNTYLQRSDGELGFASGTSFSSPVMAGMAACLWQAAPNVTAREIKFAMEISASSFLNPDSLLGYGIPDFEKAWDLFFPMGVSSQFEGKDWFVYPNPIRNFLIVQKNGVVNSDEILIEIYTLEGRLINKWIKPNNPKITLSNIGWLPQGMFLLKISSDEKSQTIKLNKIH